MTILQGVLAGLAVVAAAFGGVGALLARTPLARLHFLAAVTSIAVPLTAAAAAVSFGVSLGAATAVLIALVVALSGPPVSVAIARRLADEQGLDVERGPE